MIKVCFNTRVIIDKKLDQTVFFIELWQTFILTDFIYTRSASDTLMKRLTEIEYSASTSNNVKNVHTKVPTVRLERLGQEGSCKLSYEIGKYRNARFK